MAERPEKPDLRIYLRFEESPNYGDGSRFAHVYASPMILAVGKYASNRKLDLWSPDASDVGADESVRALDGLRISSQVSNSDPQRLYGYDRPEYEASRGVDLRRAESMIVWLRKLDREMKKRNDKFGYPQDYPQYLSYLADILCPAQRQPFMRRVTGVDYDQDYEGSGYRSMDTSTMRFWVDEQLKSWRERHGIQFADTR